MVVFFDVDGQIVQAEHFVMTPTFPANMSMVEKIVYYNENGMDFVCLNYEIGADILNYRVLKDEDSNFIALQPLEVVK